MDGTSLGDSVKSSNCSSVGSSDGNSVFIAKGWILGQSVGFFEISVGDSSGDIDGTLERLS
jgi:hypothetical protein